ncbi:uncharacterized protein LOC119522468 [Choloepus didactylus]|uniref:uncharacterized protein LOC119522468 n=1 Tax=Choloepus didactylus TaxID=27675 RepID=UPI00189DBD1F|nr:uncharacterized protein LOC119522468 [Choloepus didactylus]
MWALCSSAGNPLKGTLQIKLAWSLPAVCPQASEVLEGLLMHQYGTLSYPHFLLVHPMDFCGGRTVPYGGRNSSTSGHLDQRSEAAKGSLEDASEPKNGWNCLLHVEVTDKSNNDSRNAVRLERRKAVAKTQTDAALKTPQNQCGCITPRKAGLGLNPSWRPVPRGGEVAAGQFLLCCTETPQIDGREQLSQSPGIASVPFPVGAWSTNRHPRKAIRGEIPGKLGAVGCGPDSPRPLRSLNLGTGLARPCVSGIPPPRVGQECTASLPTAAGRGALGRKPDVNFLFEFYQRGHLRDGGRPCPLLPPGQLPGGDGSFAGHNHFFFQWEVASSLQGGSRPECQRGCPSRGPMLSVIGRDPLIDRVPNLMEPQW